MKKIKLFIGVLCIALALLCYSCSLFLNLRYNCDINKVKSIQIVKLGEFIEEKRDYDYTVLAQISDKEAFVYRLNNLKQSTNWGEPYVMEVGYVCILIDYHNGDFDLIYRNNQEKQRDEVCHSGYVVFNKEQFELLIEDYLNESESDKITPVLS